jgi:hypothetical protein
MKNKIYLLKIILIVKLIYSGNQNHRIFLFSKEYASLKANMQVTMMDDLKSKIAELEKANEELNRKLHTTLEMEANTRNRLKYMDDEVSRLGKIECELLKKLEIKEDNGKQNGTLNNEFNREKIRLSKEIHSSHAEFKKLVYVTLRLP